MPKIPSVPVAEVATVCGFVELALDSKGELVKEPEFKIDREDSDEAMGRVITRGVL